MKIEPTVTISLASYNQLLRCEKQLQDQKSEASFMAISAYGWHNNDLYFYGKDEAIQFLKNKLESSQKENRELIESLRDILREKPKTVHSIFNKIPTCWLGLKK